MNAKESVAAYCKAQAEINNIDKSNEEDKKLLNERIKTCRSLIMDELTTKNISCFELYGEDTSEPLYFRLKPTNTNVSISMEDVKSALKIINKQQLSNYAEKFENDFAKMVSATIQSIVKDKKKQSSGCEKVSLQISNNKERGYERSINQNVSDDTLRIAQDLLGAKKELEKLKQKQSEQKKQSVHVQKEVEATVKEALKQTDPKNMTTRVHMMQQDNEWVYYLRCKEQEKTVPIGIRKIIQIVETAVSSFLDEQGMPRQFSTSLQLNDKFWSGLATKISYIFELESQETKITSKLSLDRGAPRNRRKGT